MPVRSARGSEGDQGDESPRVACSRAGNSGAASADWLVQAREDWRSGPLVVMPRRPEPSRPPDRAVTRPGPPTLRLPCRPAGVAAVTLSAPAAWPCLAGRQARPRPSTGAGIPVTDMGSDPRHRQSERRAPRSSARCSGRRFELSSRRVRRECVCRAAPLDGPLRRLWSAPSLWSLARPDATHLRVHPLGAMYSPVTDTVRTPTRRIHAER